MSRTKAGLNSRNKFLMSAAVGLILMIVYISSCFPSITWWVGSQYSVMAVCLGVAPPPGSLLLTIVGWLAIKLPIGLNEAFLLNCLAGMMAVTTVLLCAKFAAKLISDNDDRITTPAESLIKKIGILLGALSLGLSFTMWRHAIMFQPYILTVLFTGLILLSSYRWWMVADKSEANRWLFILLLLFGLDFSVHRTNFLLLPGVITWVLLRYPQTIKSIRSWLAGAGGFLSGLAFHFVTMILALRQPAFNSDNATTLQNFYNYVSLKQQGGGFLINLYPRKSDIFAVQIPAFLEMVADNFFFVDGPLGWIGILPLLLALIGLIILFSRNWKLATGLIIFFLLSSLGGVIYFNTPEYYYWPMDRHYLPTLFILTTFIAIGAGRLLLAAWSSRKYHMVVTALVLLVLSAIPLNMYLRNKPLVDSSDRHFAHDYASNVLENLEPDAILIVQGEHLWPLLYLQLAEKVRPDVTLLSQSLMNTEWYVRAAKAKDPQLPLSLIEDDFRIRPWQDTTVIIILAKSEGGTDSVDISIPPTIAENYLLAQDYLLMKMIIENRFVRPVYLTTPPSWLMKHVRPEGLVWQIRPEELPENDTDQLYKNLTENYSYRGFDDSTIPLDKVSASIGDGYYKSFVSLAQSELMNGDIDRFNSVLEAMSNHLPADRMASAPDWVEAIEQMREAAIDTTTN